MKISQHFSRAEFSQRARHGQPAMPYPAEWIADRLRPLCAALEVLRAEVGRPLVVVSGYRSQAYNRAIGGARASQHVTGRAADVRCAGLSAVDLHAAALTLYRAGALKVGGLGLYSGFVHLDVRDTPRLVRWSGSRVAG
jgi:uncharacterized protein YcbK (DUF882 family)